MKSEFIIKEYCCECGKEILSIYDLGYGDVGLFLCKKCNNKFKNSKNKK